MIQDPRFDPQDVWGFRLCQMRQRLDAIDNDSDAGPLSSRDGWKCNVRVTINVPEGKTWWTSPVGRPFEVEGLCHRSIMTIVRKVYMTQRNVHYMPYELFYQPSKDRAPIQCWGDVYSSLVFLEAHKSLPMIPGCQAERVVAPLMFWSDSTHLTSFGTAKLWPIYMFF